MNQADDDARAELERLREENAELKVQLVTDQASSEAGRKTTRTAWALAMVIVAVFVLALSIPAVWLNRVVLDTDTWVRTVAPLASEEAVQDVLSVAVSDAIIEQIDSRAVAEKYLPDELIILAGPISGAVDDFVRGQADSIVRSDEFATLWEETNRVSHAALVAALTGRDGLVSIEAGTVSLETGLLAERLILKLDEAGLGFVDRIPTEALERRVVLYESSLVGQLTPAVDAMSRAAFVLPLLGLALVAGAFGLAADRRKVALWLGVGTLVAGLFPLQGIYLGQYYVVNQIAQLANSDGAAAQAIYSTIFRDLIIAEQTMTFIGIVIWVAALVAGPARWAVAVRGGLGDGLGGVSGQLELGAFGEWVAGHKSGLRTAGFTGAFLILLLFPAPRTIFAVIWAVVGLVVWLLGVEFFGGNPGQPAGIGAESEVVVIVEEEPEL